MSGTAAARTGESRPRIVIVGGGFGGLWACRALAKADAAITLLDRPDHRVFAASA